jgi:hypothetical protein
MEDFELLELEMQAWVWHFISTVAFFDFCLQLFFTWFLFNKFSIAFAVSVTAFKPVIFLC